MLKAFAVFIINVTDFIASFSVALVEVHQNFLELI